MASIGISKHTAANGRVSYLADINMKGYPRLKKTWDTEEQAAQWRRTEIAKLKDKRAGLYVAPSGSIGDLLKRYIADYGRARGGWSRAKQEGLERVIEDVGDVMIKDFTKQAVIAYGERIAQTRGPSGTKEILSYLTKVFKVGFDAYDIDTPREDMRSGMAVLRSRGLTGESNVRNRQIQPHEVVKLKQHLTPLMQDVFDALMVLPFRVSELCGIEWEHINQMDRSVCLSRKDTKKDKTEFKRKQWLALPVIAVNRGGTVTQVDTFDLIAGRDRNGYRPFPIRSEEASRQFSNSHKVSGIEDLHLHDTRAHAITALLAQGFEPLVVAEMSGHLDLNVFKKHYCRFSPRTMHDIFKRQARINQQDRRAS